MKTKNLFVKNPMKGAWASFVEILLTGLGVLTGFYFANTILPNLIKKPATEGGISPQPKLAPILTAAVGGVGTIMFTPGFLRSFSLGFAAAGITDVVSDVVLKTADKQAKYGLTTKVDGLGYLANLDVDGLDEMAGGEDLNGEEFAGNDLDGFGYASPVLAANDPLAGFGTVLENMSIN